MTRNKKPKLNWDNVGNGVFYTFAIAWSYGCIDRAMATTDSSKSIWFLAFGAVPWIYALVERLWKKRPEDGA